MKRRHGAAARHAAPTRGAGALRALLGCALAAAVLAGCTPQLHNEGHVRNPDALAEIEPGVQTRDEVARLLGTPSVVATFDDRRWYYVSRRTETVAFNAPELIEQQITVIDFDENGVVSQVASISPDEAREIEPVDEESPTRGRSVGVLEQLLGNVGRPIPTSSQ